MILRGRGSKAVVLVVRDLVEGCWCRDITRMRCGRREGPGMDGKVLARVWERIMWRYRLGRVVVLLQLLFHLAHKASRSRLLPWVNHHLQTHAHPYLRPLPPRLQRQSASDSQRRYLLILLRLKADQSSALL